MSMGWSGEVPLADIPALQIRCECCGHIKRMQGRDLRAIAAKGILTVQQLKPKLRCSQCDQRDMYLLPILRAAE